MGYRSDVRILMTENGYRYFKNAVDGYLAVRGNTDNPLDHLDINEHIGNSIYIGWDSIKWYMGFEEIDAVENALNVLDAHVLPYRFTRIGDDYDDIEERDSETDNGGLGYIYVTRKFDDNFVWRDMR